MKQEDCINQEKYVKCTTSYQEPSSIGATKEKLNLLEHNTTKEDISCQMQNPQETKDDVSVIVESLLTDKSKTWKDNISSSELDILTTKLLKTLDQESTSKEKVLTTFWNQQKMEISKKLWLPTKTDCVVSVLNSSKKSSQNGPMGKSWFSIKKNCLQNKNCHKTLYQSSQFSLPDSTVSGVTVSNAKLKKRLNQKTVKPVMRPMKTMKFRIFPNENEKRDIDLYIEHQRWYYNAAINVLFKNKGIENFTKVLKSGKEKINLSRDKLRDFMRNYEFEEIKSENKIYKNFKYNKEAKKFPVPEWWNTKELKPKDRVIRGAFDKLSSNFNSALSNKENGHIKNFNLKFRRKDDTKEFIRFEDTQIPASIKYIKSRYWYKNRNHKRRVIKIEDIYNSSNKCSGIEYIKDNLTDCYYLHCPVDRDWFYEKDVRGDNQSKYKIDKKRVISLDPGVRKFLMGYDPEGNIISIGENDHKTLMNMLLEVDKTKIKSEMLLRWKRIKNYVSELHNKTISFLIQNYDDIIIPEFRIQDMIKSKKISKMTKRLLCMYSFHSFKEKLLYKCNTYNKRFILVTEEYTSKTCTKCGILNDVGGSEVYKCLNCDIIIDRDINGARNIFIKNVSLTLET